MTDDSPWWVKAHNEELSHLLFHMLGGVSKRSGFYVTEGLRKRLLSIANKGESSDE